uniref:Transposase n=1 Tax=Brugia timori TaxID=42155 RepID=A0A0R3QDB3_9BILA
MVFCKGDFIVACRNNNEPKIIKKRDAKNAKYLSLETDVSEGKLERGL